MKRFGLLSTIAVSPILAAVIALFFGPHPITPQAVIDTFARGFAGTPGTSLPPEQVIIFEIRLPRILLAGISGAALSVSGVILQGIFHNPLADPFILGISAGAALGCALSVALFPAFPVQVAAFAFGCLAVGIAYAMARAAGSLTRLSLILSGIVVSAFFTALVSVIKFLVDPYKLQSIVFWLMGSFSLADWTQVKIAASAIGIGTIPIFLMRWQLDVISMGDTEAHTLGQHVKRERVLFILLATFLASITVSFSGIIGWVGIMIPHVLRLALGPSHRMLVPASLAGGATFVILADTVARSFSSFDLPIGIITALVGAPFFFLLLTRVDGGHW